VHFANPEKNPPRRVRVYSDEFVEELEHIKKFYAKKGLTVVDVDTDTSLTKEDVTEAWSEKYKRSINCSHPKGFSQRAHCAGKKKHNEDITMEMTCPDCGMCQTHGTLNEIKKGQKDANGYTSCWPGKHAEGTKRGKNGGQVRNCVPNESIDEAEAWQTSKGKNKNGGLNKKGVASYRRSHPGSKLQTAVTTKPSKLKPGSKAAKRRKSFCARMKGMKKHNTNSKTAHDPNSRINKSLRKWHCESQEQFDAMLYEAVEKSNLQPGQYYIWKVYFDDGTHKRIKVTKDNFDPKAYYAKQNKVVVNVDYSWDPHNG
jgi:hypothetical protein